jgi:hypothetical protein
LVPGNDKTGQEEKKKEIVPRYKADWVNDSTMHHGGIYCVVDTRDNEVIGTTGPFKDGWEQARIIADALNTELISNRETIIISTVKDHLNEITTLLTRCEHLLEDSGKLLKTFEG